MADNYYIDTDTKNLSFLNMYRYIQNHECCYNYEFILKTIDKRLLKFNYDEFMSDGNKKDKFAIIKEECKNNIWFFFREIARIPNDMEFSLGIHPETKYILNFTEMQMIFAYEHNKRFVALNTPELPKSGITTTLTLLSLYEDFIVNDRYKKSVYILEDINSTHPSDKLIHKKIKQANDHIFLEYLEGEDDSSSGYVSNESSMFLITYNNDKLEKLSSVLVSQKANTYHNICIEFGNITNNDLGYNEYSKCILSSNKVEILIRNLLFSESMIYMNSTYDFAFKIFDNIASIPERQMVLIMNKNYLPR